MQNEQLVAFENALSDFATQHKLDVAPATEVLSKDLTVSQRLQVGRVFHSVVKALNDNQLYGAEMYSDQFAFSDGRAIERMSSVNYGEMRDRAFIQMYSDLCDVAGISPVQKAETMRALNVTLHRYLSKGLAVEHWDSSNHGSKDIMAMNTIYPQGALSDVSFGSAIPGQEAFGASMDTVLPDIRLAMTVVLLKPHKGIMSRLLHRRTVAGSVIQYIIHNDEFYDLTQSQAKVGDVRNSYEHRIPIVALYRRPDPINMQLQPIIPAKSLDPDDKWLVSDGVMKFDSEVNMFDLSMNPTKIGYNNINWTDLVSEGVLISAVYFEVSNKDGSTVEQFSVSTVDHKNARLVAPAQVDDSGERVTNLQFTVPFHAAVAKTDNTASTLFSAIPADSDVFVEAVVNVAPRINLKTAVAEATGSVRLRTAVKQKGLEPTQAIKDMVTGADAYTVKLVGYMLDAKFSEENLRKVNMAVRTQVYTAMYELPQGKSIVVDFSMQQTVPEHVLNTAQEVQAIGIDHRNLQAFLKLMTHVHNQGLVESNDPMYRQRNNGRTLNTSFVSGQRVNPTVLMGKIDLARVASVRSSDMLGDVRQFMDSYLNKMASLLHLRSLYVQQLDNGEIPVYKVLTSGPIIENLFSIPHIHNHLHPDGMNAEKIFREKTPGEPVEFKRVLPSGVVLECISTPFEYMKDKIMIIPFRAGDANSELNFAHNWDGGQFVANYTPVDQNQVNKRVFMNTREWPVPTCPCGMLIQVVGLETVLPDVTVAPDQPFPA